MAKDSSSRISNVTRRDALGMISVAAALPLAVASEAASADESGAGSRPGIYRGEHIPKPLPLDPKALPGLSERLLLSHHENNYAGAVRRLNAIERRIAALPVDAAPFELGSLKREVLVAANSMRLHELYFRNLGGKGIADGPFAALTAAQYGSRADWENDFRRTAHSLAGGSGWVITTWEPETGALHNVWAWDHMHGLAGGVPLLVLDMYEHAYHMDYGTNAKAYVDAFFANVQGEAVDRRLASTTRLGTA